jgi:raffinose/stachyose/melibiose transport system substrate-binding protein
MSVIRRAVAAAFCLALSAGLASAETTVKWLHIEVNPNQVKLWEEVARDFEAKNSGVKVEM